MDTGRYKCLNCNGEGKVIKSGPECNDYVASCTHCGGSGLRQITVSLKEFEQNRESGGVVTDRRGLTDEETESRAIKAIGRAMEALEKSTPTSVKKATNASKSFSGRRAQGLSPVKRSDLAFSCFPFP